MKVTIKPGESIGLHVNATPVIRQGKSKKIKGKTAAPLPFSFPFSLEYYAPVAFAPRHVLAIQELQQRNGVFARNPCQLFE
jgi:hypothetical protein